MTIKRRLTNLEKRSFGTQLKPFRFFVSVIGRPFNLATSRCERTLGRNGRLTEIVWLDGGPAGLSEAELERFIAQFLVTSAYR